MRTVLPQTLGELGSPRPRGCNVVTSTVPITTTPALENTLALQTILMLTVRTAAPQPRMELLLVQQQAYQEEQQPWVHTQQINAELRAAQHHDKLAGEHPALDA
jgi:hypothetical protein